MKLQIEKKRILDWSWIIQDFGIGLKGTELCGFRFFINSFVGQTCQAVLLFHSSRGVFWVEMPLLQTQTHAHLDGLRLLVHIVLIRWRCACPLDWLIIKQITKFPSAVLMVPQRLPEDEDRVNFGIQPYVGTIRCPLSISTYIISASFLRYCHKSLSRQLQHLPGFMPKS